MLRGGHDNVLTPLARKGVFMKDKTFALGLTALVLVLVLQAMPGTPSAVLAEPDGRLADTPTAEPPTATATLRPLPRRPSRRHPLTVFFQPRQHRELQLKKVNSCS
jgi:hypothetical protein